MRHNTGRQRVAVGTYREVEPPRRLVFSLRASAAGTDMLLTHEGFSEGKDRDDHDNGWTGCMEMLARMF